MNDYYIVLLSNQDDSSILLQPPDGQEQNVENPANTVGEGTTVTQQVSSQSSDENAGLGSMLPMLAFWGIMMVGIFWFSNRSQKKKQKAVEEMQQGIVSGTEVYTSGGLYGKVVEVNEQNFIVEFGTNKGVRIPVRKSDVFVAKK